MTLLFLLLVLVLFLFLQIAVACNRNDRVPGSFKTFSCLGLKALARVDDALVRRRGNVVRDL